MADMEYIKRCPVKECTPKGLDRQYAHLCGKNECNALKAYKQGRADERKDFADVAFVLSREEIRRTRISAIDECIKMVKSHSDDDRLMNDYYVELLEELKKG